MEHKSKKGYPNPTPEKLEELRKSLGETASQLTEAQLIQLRRELDAWAELLLDIYCEKYGISWEQKEEAE